MILKQYIINNIGTSTAAEIGLISKMIIDQDIAIEELLDILHLPHPVSTRFSWLLGDLSTQHSEMAPKILRACFKNRKEIRIKNFDRSIAKQCHLCGTDLPEELEGEIVSQLFDWLSSSSISVSTKYHCLLALQNQCQKYPDLKEEFIDCIQYQMDLNTDTFKKKVKQVLKEL